MKLNITFCTILNIQSLLHIDMSEKFGLFTGLGYRNVGYIYDNYSTVPPVDVTQPIKKKFRTYNIGIPVGVKLGNMDGLYSMADTKLNFLLCTRKRPLIQLVKKSTQMFTGLATGQIPFSKAGWWAFSSHMV